MGKITVETCHIEGLKVITPTVFGDERGYFMETYNYNDYKAAGIDMEFVQDNQSSSRRGVLRGLHFQINYPQDKLVRVVSGEVFDVAVDLREGSETYGQWYGVVLSAENKKQFFIPKNFAHGFVVTILYTLVFPISNPKTLFREICTSSKALVVTIPTTALPSLANRSVPAPNKIPFPETSSC